jgi:hypothetical protein
MAKATIVHHWAEGGHVTLTFHADAEHPDALDQIVARVLAMYHAAVLDPDPDEAEQ